MCSRWPWKMYNGGSQSSKVQVTDLVQSLHFTHDKNGSSEMLSDLPKVIKLVSDGTDIKVVSPEAHCAPQNLLAECMASIAGLDFLPSEGIFLFSLLHPEAGITSFIYSNLISLTACCYEQWLELGD